MKKFLVLLIASLALFTGQADAQRRLPGMKGLQLTAGMTDGFYNHSNRDKTGYNFGAALSTYTKGGNQWILGGEFLQRYYPYGEDERIPVAQFTAEGGYYYNILSDAKKIFFLNIGASALAGYETVNGGKYTLFDGAGITQKDAFIYGGAVTLNLETYLSDRVVLLLNLRERALWGNSTDRFHTEFGLGLRFILN